MTSAYSLSHPVLYYTCYTYNTCYIYNDLRQFGCLSVRKKKLPFLKMFSAVEKKISGQLNGNLYYFFNNIQPENCVLLVFFKITRAACSQFTPASQCTSNFIGVYFVIQLNTSFNYSVFYNRDIVWVELSLPCMSYCLSAHLG